MTIKNVPPLPPPPPAPPPAAPRPTRRVRVDSTVRLLEQHFRKLDVRSLREYKLTADDRTRLPTMDSPVHLLNSRGVRDLLTGLRMQSCHLVAVESAHRAFAAASEDFDRCGQVTEQTLRRVKGSPPALSTQDLAAACDASHAAYDALQKSSSQLLETVREVISSACSAPRAEPGGSSESRPNPTVGHAWLEALVHEWEHVTGRPRTELSEDVLITYVMENAGDKFSPEATRAVDKFTRKRSQFPTCFKDWVRNSGQDYRGWAASSRGL